jgi:hypothetical protein
MRDEKESEREAKRARPGSRGDGEAVKGEGKG